MHFDVKSGYTNPTTMMGPTRNFWLSLKNVCDEVLFCSIALNQYDLWTNPLAKKRKVLMSDVSNSFIARFYLWSRVILPT